MSPASTMPHDPLANPQLRSVLLRAARRRVVVTDAEDIVQGVLLEALAAPDRPAQAEDLERWLRAVLRNKIIDFYRKSRRETPLPEDHELGFDEPDLDLLKWAVAELPNRPDATKALEWAVREGAGEKLEQIAETEALPAPRVRKQVSRLRQHFRRRWALYAATLAAVLVVYAVFHRGAAPIARDNVTPEERGRVLRQRAFEECPSIAPDACLERLDEAKRLDPAGDASDAVRALRESVVRSKAPPAPTGSVPTEMIAPPTVSAVPSSEGSTRRPRPTSTATPLEPTTRLMPPMTVPRPSKTGGK